MKLTHLFTYLFAAAAALTSCTDIDEAQRFIKTDTGNSLKNVLVEDFTGQKCSNCPKAADAIQDMQKTFGSERLIAVSIHGGSLSLLEDGKSNAGLATALGNAYVDHWGIKSFPKGLVDRTGGNMDYEYWNAAALKRFNVAPKASIEVKELVYDEASRTINLTTAVEGKENVEGNLQVWLTESDIVSSQTQPNGKDNAQYVHNHVFRAALNGDYGEALTLTNGETQTKNYTYTLARDFWNAQNMALVIFFYNDADGVMQVIDAPLYKGGRPSGKELKGITLDHESLELYVGTTESLMPTFNPSDAADKSVEWTSSDESVATVNADGEVTAVAEGEATITVTSVANPAISASCQVVVKEADTTSSIEITFNGEKVHNGDVLTIPVVEIDYGGGYKGLDFGDASNGADPKFTNTTDGFFPIPVTVKVELQGDFRPWAICGLGLGSCYTMNTMSYECSFSLAAGRSETSQIHFEGFEIGQYGTADIVCHTQIDGKDISYTLHFVYEAPTK